jgi:hypothetical protein
MWVKGCTGQGLVVYFCAVSILKFPFFVYWKILLAAWHFLFYGAASSSLLYRCPHLFSKGHTCVFPQMVSPKCLILWEANSALRTALVVKN